MRLDPSYAQMLARTPLMPADEQQSVAERHARTRSPSDAQRLVLGNLRLVLKIVRDLGGHRPRETMDMVQEGNAGLAYAVQRFDPKRGVKLSSYAAWWIRAYVLRYLMDSARIAHFSSTREGRKRFFAGTLPGPDRSLDAPAAPRGDGDGDPRPMWNVLAGDEQDRPDVVVEEREYQERVRRAIADFEPTLDERQRTIFEARLLGDKPPRLADVGRRWAISAERTRQIERQIMDNLRGFVTRTLDSPGRIAA